MTGSEKQTPESKCLETASIWSDFDLDQEKSYFNDEQNLEHNSFLKMTSPKIKSFANQKPSNSSRHWVFQDEEKLIQLHKENGNKWTNLAQFFPPTSQNEIKNRFYSKLRKSVRKVNRSIEVLKLRQYNKFKLNIIFQLSNISEGKLSEKDRVSPQIFQFYKEFLYELIEFSNQNPHLESQVKSFDQKKSEVQSLILPLIALENLFRLVRGERAAKGKKKNIAYLRQFTFRLSLQTPIAMVITKEKIYIQNQNEIQVSQVSEQNSQTDSTMRTEIQIENPVSITNLSMLQSFEEKSHHAQEERLCCPQLASSNTFIEENEDEGKPYLEQYKDYFESVLQEIDFFSHKDLVHDKMNQFHLTNFREMDFSDEKVFF